MTTRLELPGWARIRMGFQNLGGHITPGQVLDLMHWVSVLGMVECSDRQDVVDALERAGFKVARLTGEPGQAATAVAYDPADVELLDVQSFPLYKGGDIGPGTGPDNGKPKWLLVVKFRHIRSGRILLVAVEHLYAGQSHAERERICRDMISKTAIRLGARTGVVVLLIDANDNPTSPTLAQLRRDGWKNNHIVLGRITTHSVDWSPDQAWVHDLFRLLAWSRFEFITHRTVKNWSDHRGLIVVGRLRLTWKRNRQERAGALKIRGA